MDSISNVRNNALSGSAEGFLKGARVNENETGIIRDTVSVGEKTGAEQGILTAEQARNIKGTSEASAVGGVTGYGSAHVSGRVGNEYASASITQNAMRASTTGMLEGRSFYINETISLVSSSIFGSVSTSSDYKNVNLQAYGKEGSRSISGMIGSGHVSLRESSAGPNSYSISGMYGNSSVSLSYRKMGGRVSLSGHVMSAQSGYQNVNLSGLADGDVSYLGLIPVALMAAE